MPFKIANIWFFLNATQNGFYKKNNSNIFLTEGLIKFSLWKQK